MLVPQTHTGPLQEDEEARSFIFAISGAEPPGSTSGEGGVRVRRRRCTWPCTARKPGRQEIARRQLPPVQELVKRQLFPPHSYLRKQTCTLQPSPQFGAYLPNKAGLQMPPCAWRSRKARAGRRQLRRRRGERAPGPAPGRLGRPPEQGPPREPLGRRAAREVGGGHCFECTAFSVKGAGGRGGLGKIKIKKKKKSGRRAAFVLADPSFRGSSSAPVPAGKSLLASRLAAGIRS